MTIRTLLIDDVLTILHKNPRMTMLEALDIALRHNDDYKDFYNHLSADARTALRQNIDLRARGVAKR